MINIILNSLIVSMTIIGFHLIIEFLLSDWLKMELTDIYDKFSGTIWIKLFKPLFLCPTCMTSIWGIPLYFTLYEFELITFIIHIGTVGLFNYIIAKKFL